MPAEINWLNIGMFLFTVVGGCVGIGGFLVARGSRSDARRERERIRIRDRSAREDQTELGYVAELHERIENLEATNDALRHELAEGSTQRIAQAERGEEFWQTMAMRLIGPLEESNRLSEMARALIADPPDSTKGPSK